MARKVKPDEHAAKRGDILDAALRLITTKGYERMTIQDIRGEVGISSGALYHYFDSKQAVLEGIIDRIRETVEIPLLPIIRDPNLTALEKLQGFFDTLDQMRLIMKAEVIRMGRVWYADENAVVRQKVDDAMIQQRAPLLNEIVQQGIAEGVFTTAYPEQAGEIILSLLHGMGNTHARLMFRIMKGGNDPPLVEEFVTVHWAFMDAIERALGAPPRSLYRADAAAVQVWIDALRAEL